MMIPIVSRDNKTLKIIRSLQRKKGRMEKGLYFIEGVRIVKEAIRYQESAIQAIVASDSFAQKNEAFLRALVESGKTIYTAKESLFQELCDTEAPQGIGAVLAMPENTDIDFANAKFLLILDGVSEPGNLGTIIRTAEAAGVDGVILMKGCADLYNPKVVRSTMGSLFRVPCMYGVDLELVHEIKNQGFSLIATALKNSIPVGDATVQGKCAIIIGSEASGVSEKILKLSDVCVHIPMEGEVESLNAGVAAGICMYLLKP